MINLNKMHNWWANLPYWQKGGILGGSLHLILLVLILSVNTMFVPRIPPPGAGDMGTFLGWVLFGLFWLLEFVPFFLLRLVLYQIAGITYRFPAPESISDLQGAWSVCLYIGYATIFYILLGVTIAKVIGFFKVTR
jgi:hypothetical protein